MNKISCDVYTDGSYKDGIIGSGVVFVCGNKIEEFAFSIESEELATHRNVSGEIYAVMYAIFYAWKEGIKKLRIFHDYSGLAFWIGGEWRTKTELTRLYKTFIERYKRYIDIEFVKVQAHKGNHLNNFADKLAKKVLEGWTFAPHLDEFLREIQILKSKLP